MRKIDPFDHNFYEYDLTITEYEKLQTLIYCKDLKEDGMQTSYYKSFDVLNLPALSKLKKQIIKILDKHGLTISNSWAQLYKENNFHAVHTHKSSVKSGIIYMVSQTRLGTLFYNPESFVSYQHPFKRNTLLLFPSHIPHEVRPLEKDEEKYIISFNTEYKK